jgi:2-C-methyl-D-erythritol 2,4-cyclodiphosphate synthase
MLRNGIGYDIHPLVRGRKLFIGGVEIPSEMGALGHSDGDVLIHAICDALLGACGLGDIGKLFPDSDERYKDARSESFLLSIREILRERGCEILNIDSIVILEKPKISSFIDEMRRGISSMLEIDIDRISVKAKRGEKLDSIGRGEAIACFAIALVEMPEKHSESFQDDN